MKVELLPGVHLVAGGQFRYPNMLGANVYLVRGASRIVLVDAGCGFGSDALLGCLSLYGVGPRDIDAIIITHSHWDHARGAAELIRRGVREVWIHEAGVARLEVGPTWIDFGAPVPAEITFEPVKISRVLSDGDVIQLGGRELTVIHTPGHTDDSVSILLQEDGRRFAFTGDTILGSGGLGVTTADTPFPTLRDSIRRLATLGIDGIFPGHGIWIMNDAADVIGEAASRLSGWWRDLTPIPSTILDRVKRTHPELLAP